MKITSFFNELSKIDTHIAGGKGASLGEMTQAGIPVPPGFVVLTDAFERFLDETELNEEIQAQLDTVNHHELESVERASENIRALISNVAMPEEIKEGIYASFEHLDAEWVAVRSSATAEDSADASWAGELESYLNTSREDLLEKVQLCWSSLFTPRAIFYRFEKGFHKGKVSVAVVVQKMVASEISGIAFSVHPVTEDPNQLIIEAGYGLGEAIVSGAVTPDNYVIDKRDWSVLDIYISSQERAIYKKDGGGNEWTEVDEGMHSNRKLQEEKTLELAYLIVRIEEHYGFPCDIEWAMEGEKLFIVQSRPITTLVADGKSQTVINTQNNDVAKGVPRVNKEQWTYLGQWHQPALSDCFWSYWHITDAVKGIMPEHAFHTLLSPDCQFWAHKEDVQYFWNRMGGLVESGSAHELVQKLRSVGDEIKKVCLEHSASQLQGYEENLPRLFNDFREITGVWTLCWLLGDEVGKYLTQELKKYTEEELLAIVSSNTRPTWLEEQYQGVVRLAGEINSQVPGIMPEQVNEELLSRPPYLLDMVKDFVKDYEWYGTHHWMGEPYDMTQCLEQIKEYMVKGEVTKHEDVVEVNDDTGLVDLLLEFTYWRTHSAEVAAKIVYEVRASLQSCASAMGLSYDDFIYLTDAEILSFINKGEKIQDISSQIAERKIAYGCYLEGDALQVHTGKVLQDFIAQLEDHAAGEKGEELKGLVACKGGTVRGVARVVIAPKDLAGFQKGDILVAPETTPDFVPYMQMASAVVTDRGGVTSHAAIVSRELNVPCVIGTTRATRVIKSGSLIEVNSENGEIKIIKQGE